jgi:PAS domain S-box-containing protein
MTLEERPLAGPPGGQLEWLWGLVRRVSASLDLDAVLREVTRAAGELTGAAAVALYLADDAGERLELRALSDERLGDFVRPSLRLGEGLAGWVGARRSWLAVAEAAADPRTLAPDLWRRHGLSAFLGVPVALDDALLGVLALYDRRPLGPEGYARTLLAGLAAQAAVAIRHAGLYREAERARRRAEVLAAVTRELNTSLDPDAVLQRVVEGARELCGADLAHLALRDAAGPGVTVAFRYWAGQRRSGVQPFRVEPGKGVGGQVLLTGRPFRTDDYRRDPRLTPHYLGVIEAEGVLASMAVPVVIDGQIEGLVFVDSRSRAFTDADEARLAQLADQAAVAVRNVRLFAREQALRAAAVASERRFRDLVESLEGIVWEAEVGVPGATFVSRRAEALLGYPAARWVAEPDFWARHLHPEDRDRVVALARGVAGRPDRVEVEYRMLAADGRVVWLRDVVLVARDAAGQPRQLRGYMVDVTAARQAARRAEAQHAVARILSEAAGPAEAVPALLRVLGEGFGWDLAEFWRLDPEAGLLRLEEVWHPPGAPWAERRAPREAAALPRGAGLVGRAWAEERACWTPDAPVDPRAAHAGVAAFGVRGALAFPVRRGAEVLGVIGVLARRVREPEPEVLATLESIGSQVGQYLERERAAAAARASEARKAAIVETALDAIVSMDAEGRITEFNPAAEAIFGYRREEAVGRDLAELLIPSDTRERHRAAVRAYLDGGGTGPLRRRMELTARRADGSTFRCELAITHLPDAGPARFTGFVRDITERVRLEEQLRQAQKMEAVGQLAGGVAHDFNNLLAVVMGHAELMLGELRGSDPQREHAEEIRRAAERAAALTRQLLAFSRRQFLHPEVLDLRTVATQVAGMLRRIIGEHIRLDLRLGPGPVPVRADRGQVERCS